MTLLELVKGMEHDQRNALMKEYEDPDHPGYRIRRWESKCSNDCWRCKIERWAREHSAIYLGEAAALNDDFEHDAGEKAALERCARELVGDER